MKNLRQRIMELLSESALTTREVADALGIEKKSGRGYVSRIQKEMLDAGYLRIVGKKIDATGKNQVLRAATGKYKPPLSKDEWLRIDALDALKGQSMTQVELARYLGVKRSKASEVIRILREKGEIKTTGQYTGSEVGIEHIYTSTDSYPEPSSPRYEGKCNEWLGVRF